MNSEKALAKRHCREREKWSEHTRDLRPLDIGDQVYIQNLLGKNPLRWDRTGVVVEVKPFRQYSIRVDGTGRVTLRNRRNLRKFTPFYGPEKPNNQLTHKLLVESPVPRVGDSISKNVEEPLSPSGETVSDPDAPDVPSTRGETVIHAPAEVDQREHRPPVGEKELPLALRRLLPHNKPGRLEEAPLPTKKVTPSP